MDKVITKMFAEREQINQAKYLVLHQRKFERDPDGIAADAAETLGLRCLSNRLARGPLLALVKLKPWQM